MAADLFKSEALFSSLQSRDFHNVEQLLQEGANPNILLLNGVTPFHIAVAGESTSSLDYVKLILRFNGNPNVRDVNGVTPIHIAAQWGRADCLDLLLQCGADITLADKDGHDVVWYARDNKYCKLIIEEYIAFEIKNQNLNQSICTSRASCSGVSSPSYAKKISSLQHCKETCCSNQSYEDELLLSTCNHKDTRQASSNSVNKTSNWESETMHYVIDATSPDHCIMYPKNKHIRNMDISNCMYNTEIIPDMSKKDESLCEENLLKKDFVAETTSVSIPSYVNLNTRLHNGCSFKSVQQLPCLCHSVSDDLQKHCDKLHDQPNAFVKDTFTFQHLVSCDKKLANDSVNDIIYTTDDSTLPIDKSALFSEDKGQEISKVTGNFLKSQKREDQIQLCNKSKHCSTVSNDRQHKQNCSDNLTVSDENETKVLYTSEDGTSLIECLHLPLTRSTLQNEENFSAKLSLSVDPCDDNTVLYDSYDWQALSDYDSINKLLTSLDHIPIDIDQMSDTTLRRELLKYGFNPGPIRHARKMYKKRLYRLRQGLKPESSKDMPFSRELCQVIRGMPLSESVIKDDHSLRQQFDDPHGSLNLRGGSVKDSFNYLLLDPRVSQKLPQRTDKLSETEALKIFAGATFYVGKGKKSRPYEHLKEALQDNHKKNRKIDHILDIWNSGCGVISLHVFQNIIPSEAFTREACMIEAIGLDHLTNQMRGKCYGLAEGWDRTRTRSYGTYLIVSAMQMFLLEGEREIRRNQIHNKK